MGSINIICSSSRMLRQWLEDARGFIDRDEWEFYLDSDNHLLIERFDRRYSITGSKLSCTTRRISIDSESVVRLLRFLDIIRNQEIEIILYEHSGGTIEINKAIL